MSNEYVSEAGARISKNQRYFSYIDYRVSLYPIDFSGVEWNKCP
jgi:hypothetical protein